jgi:hypothetical protein
MKTGQAVVRGRPARPEDFRELAGVAPQLVLAFGSVQALRDAAGMLAQVFPQAVRAGCSTAGEIAGQAVEDGVLVVTAVRMDKIRMTQASTVLAGMSDSFAAGKRLASALPAPGLRAVFLLGQGVRINGSAVLAGLTEMLGPRVPITGGLAGDGGAFEQTWVLDAQGVSDDRLTAIGLYGDALVFAHGSFGGWTPFGPVRKVTRCDGNVLYAVDDEPALRVYKRYLGEHANGLPASGLLFPLAMLGSDHSEVGLIRTILGVDEAQGSLTLAGDIDPDGYLRLMHASTDALVDGAEAAALAAKAMQSGDGNGLVLLVSCVGRKLVMGGRVDEEVEAVAQVFGQGATLAGFYSYGEISPYMPGVGCKLHNQTMTVTYIAEAA